MKFFADINDTELQEMLYFYSNIIVRFEEIYQTSRFSHQTAQSLTELHCAVIKIKPKTIFEIGCGSRSSTVALALAAGTLANNCILYGIDIEPIPFKEFSLQHFPDYMFCKTVEIRTDAREYTIPQELPRPWLFLYDAHDDDVPGFPLSEYAIREWFPVITDSWVFVHDCSVFDVDNPFTGEDYHVNAVHFSGRKIIGYKEVANIVQYLNHHEISFLRPGDELIERAVGGGGDSSLICFKENSTHDCAE